MTRTVDLDISGLVCPRTVAVVRRALTAMDPGDELAVTGEDPSTARSIRRTCYKHGYEVQTLADSGDGEFTLLIAVTEEPAVEPR